MAFLDLFKFKKVENELTEIQLLEIELQIATDDRLYAQLVVDKMRELDGHDREYSQHKRLFLLSAEKAVRVARTKLKQANIKHHEEPVIKSDIKAYEKRMRCEILRKTELPVLKDVIRERCGDVYYD